MRIELNDKLIPKLNELIDERKNANDKKSANELKQKVHRFLKVKNFLNAMAHGPDADCFCPLYQEIEKMLHYDLNWNYLGNKIRMLEEEVEKEVKRW